MPLGKLISLATMERKIISCSLRSFTRGGKFFKRRFRLASTDLLFALEPLWRYVYRVLKFLEILLRLRRVFNDFSMSYVERELRFSLRMTNQYDWSFGRQTHNLIHTKHWDCPPLYPPGTWRRRKFLYSIVSIGTVTRKISVDTISFETRILLSRAPSDREISCRILHCRTVELQSISTLTFPRHRRDDCCRRSGSHALVPVIA